MKIKPLISILGLTLATTCLSGCRSTSTIEKPLSPELNYARTILYNELRTNYPSALVPSGSGESNICSNSADASK